MAFVGEDDFVAGEQFAPVAGVPELDGLVVAGGSDAWANGRPGYPIDPGGVIAMDKGIVACSGIPDLHGVIPGAGYDTRAVGRPRQCLHPSAVTAIRVNGPLLPEFPDLHRRIVAGRGQQIAVLAA